MFRKIFKYDFRSTSRLTLLFIPLMWLLAATAALLIQAMQTKLFQHFTVLELGAGLGVFFSVIAMGCFPFAVLILCLRRYYTHFFSDEGYLTFTLPVKREILLLSKTLSAVLTLAIAAVAEVIAFLLLIVLAGGGLDFLKELGVVLNELFVKPQLWPTVLLGVITVVVTVFGELALMYFSVTLGQILAKKHRILAAFGLWYGINFVKRMISQTASLFYLFTVADSIDYLAADSTTRILGMTNIYIGIVLVFEAACFFGFYFWNQYLLKNKLSLS